MSLGPELSLRLALPEIGAHVGAELIESPELFRALFEHAPIGIVVGGADYKFIRINPAFCHFLGYQESELIGKDLRLITMDEDIPVSLNMHRQLIEGGGPVTYEKRYVRKDASVFWAQVTTTLVRDAGGQFVCAFSMIENISHRKHMEIALKNMSDTLSRSNAELEQFAFHASHDLREPLRVIAQLLQLLTKRHAYALTEDALELVTIASQSAKRLDMMIQGLLALARVHSSPPDWQFVSMEAAVGIAVENLSQLIKEHDAQVFHDPLPQTWCSLSQMSGVFQNLIDNAIKQQGKEKPSIHISCSRENNEWIFSIQDNGLGFPPEKARKLFNSYDRFPTAQLTRGCGFGLALCKKIVEAHGGRIWAESTEGHGATFRFSLPADTSQDVK